MASLGPNLHTLLYPLISVICAYADGSVRGINYDIDLETFNRLALRSDGEGE